MMGKVALIACCLEGTLMLLLPLKENVAGSFEPENVQTVNQQSQLSACGLGRHIRDSQESRYEQGLVTNQK